MIKSLLRARKKFLSPPVFPDDDEKTRIAAILYAMLLTITLLVPIVVISSMLDGNIRAQAIAAIIVFFFILLGLQIPMRKGYISLTASILVVIFTALITAFVAIDGTIRAPALIYFVLASVMAGLLISRQAALVSAIANSTIVFALLAAEINGLLPPPILSVSIAQGINFAVGSVWLVVMLNLATQSIDKSLALARSEIAERKQTELALQQLDDMYRRAIGAAGAVPYILDESMHSFMFIGEGIQQMTGYSASEMNSEIWKLLIQEGIPRGRLAHLTYEEADCITDEDHSLLWECDFRIRTRDGQTRWIADTSVKGIDEKSGRLVAIGIKQDITGRKLAEFARQKLEVIYRRAIDAAGAVPYVLSHDVPNTFNFTFIGEGIASITGYSASEITADLWNSLRLDAFPRGRLSHLTFEEADRLTNENHSILWECDFHIRTRDGQERWIADTSVKSFDEQSGKLVSIGIYQDITERKLAEELREKLIGELEQRNAELERITYTLSHELKSPLITIRGFMGYLRDDALSGNVPRLERDIHRVNEGADKMLRLINELIDLMSVGRVAHESKEFPLRALADEAVELVRERMAQKNIAVHIADDLPTVYGDRKRLLEVFQNLLENSVKYMGEPTEPKIEIGQIFQQDSAPIFYIRDTGIGIDPRFNERIFRIFEKLDVMSEGTGIGLALVKRIIETHGGRIWIESEGVGKGSTFCFTIPDGRSKE